jgi:hypothetical protein
MLVGGSGRQPAIVELIGVSEVEQKYWICTAGAFVALFSLMDSNTRLTLQKYKTFRSNLQHSVVGRDAIVTSTPLYSNSYFFLESERISDRFVWMCLKRSVSH